MTKEFIEEQIFKIRERICGLNVFPAEFGYADTIQNLHSHIEYLKQHPNMKDDSEPSFWDVLAFAIGDQKVYSTTPRSKPSDDLDVHSMNLV